MKSNSVTSARRARKPYSCVASVLKISSSDKYSNDYLDYERMAASINANVKP